MNTRKNIAFTVELFSLFILLIMVITVISGVFVMSRSHSLEAKRLTEAVIMAESAAEVASSERDVRRLAEKAGNLKGVLSSDCDIQSEAADAEGTVWYTDGRYTVSIERRFEEQNDKGVLAADVISVYRAAPAAKSAAGSLADVSGEPLYTLRSGKFFREVQ